MYNIYLKNIAETMEKRKERGPILESNYLSSIIKNRRLQLKLTLSETTKNLCSEAFLSKIERNLMSPINDRVELLCERLNLDYNSLINLESNDRIEKLLNFFINNKYEEIIKLNDQTIEGVFIAQDEIIKCYKYFINNDFKKLHLSIIDLDNVKECLSDLELFALLLIIFETYLYTSQYHKAKQYIYLIESINFNNKQYELFIKEREFVLNCKMNSSNVSYLFSEIHKNFHLYDLDKQFYLNLNYYSTLDNSLAYEYVINMGKNYIPNFYKDEYYYTKVLLLTKLNKNLKAMKEIIECGMFHIKFACLFAYNLLMFSNDDVSEIEVKKHKSNLVNYIKLCDQSAGEIYHIAFLRLMQYEIDKSSLEIICNYIKNQLLKELRDYSYPLYDNFINERYCLLLGKLCRYKDAYLYLLDMKIHLNNI